MIAVGLTGGIGSGKSTVARLLEERGAVVVDADALARAVLAPGRPELDAVVARFGRGVVDATGALDREALARIVFADASAREDLEAIVHPAVRGAIARELDARRRGSDVVVVEIPLLVETGGRERFALDRVLVVEAPEDVAIARLVSSRTLSEQEARARIAAQATPEARRSAADVLIVNDGTRAELESDVARAWAWLEGVAAGRAEV